MGIPKRSRTQSDRAIKTAKVARDVRLSHEQIGDLGQVSNCQGVVHCSIGKVHSARWIARILIKPAGEFVVAACKHQQGVPDLVLSIRKDLIEESGLCAYDVDQVMGAHQVVRPDVLLENAAEVIDRLCVYRRRMRRHRH